MILQYLFEGGSDYFGVGFAELPLLLQKADGNHLEDGLDPELRHLLTFRAVDESLRMEYLKVKQAFLGQPLQLLLRYDSDFQDVLEPDDLNRLSRVMFLGLIANQGSLVAITHQVSDLVHVQGRLLHYEASHNKGL